MGWWYTFQTPPSTRVESRITRCRIKRIAQRGDCVTQWLSLTFIALLTLSSGETFQTHDAMD